MSANDPNHVAYVRGHKLFKRGRFAPAAKWFSVAIEEWPEDWQALWALGNCHSELKNPKKAERCFRDALELASPKDRPMRSTSSIRPRMRSNHRIDTGPFTASLRAAAAGRS